MLEFGGNINLDDYILIDIEDVFLSNEYETYDIEIEEVNCFEARNPNSGFSSISHNSAMISLSNLSDERMRHAKSGAWWEANPQRALSNNSTVYTEKPDVGIFMKEWLSIYESKSGERGIFSREAAKKVVERNGRRNINHDFGCNPCCVSGNTILDVLFDDNTISQRITISDLSNYVRNNPSVKVMVKAWNFEKNEIEYNSINFIGITRENAKVLRITDTETNKSITITPDHNVWTENRGWVEAKDLRSDDTLKIC